MSKEVPLRRHPIAIALLRDAMEATVMTTSAAAPKPLTYHVGPWRYLWMWFVFGPLALLCLCGALLSDTPDERAGLLAGFAAFAVVLAALQVMIFRARLILSEQGVSLRQIGYRIDAPWREVVTLRLDRGREGFVTAHPIEGKGMRLLGDAAGAAPLVGYDFYDAEQHALLAEHRLIPIEAFAWHLRSGTMRRELVRLAPHLRNDLTALNVLHPGPAPKVQGFAPKATRRQKLSAAAIIIAALIGSLVLIGMGDRAVAWFTTVAYSIVNPLIALGTGINAWLLLKRKSWFMGGLLVAMTLIAVCWTILDWSHLEQLIATSAR